MTARAMQGVLLDLPENADQFVDKHAAEAVTSGLVPSNRLRSVIPEFGTKNQRPTHRPTSDLSCCFILEKGKEDSGEARCASSRF
jgi:hypothetical protein